MKLAFEHRYSEDMLFFFIPAWGGGGGVSSKYSRLDTGFKFFL